MELLIELWQGTGIAQLSLDQGVMLLIGLGLLYLAIAKGFEPLLLVAHWETAAVVALPADSADARKMAAITAAVHQHRNR